MAGNGLKSGQRWTRAETLSALNLYSRTAFGKLHSKNPEIVRLAGKLGRTSGSVAMKCCNFASLDPSLKARGIKGLKRTSKLDRQVWGEFYEKPELIGYESEIVYSNLLEREPRMLKAHAGTDESSVTDRLALRRVRVTQHLFRDMILAGYKAQCAVCTLPAPMLLVASHIVGWAIDESNRMNPRNGICLCSIHDKAFDLGLLDIDEEFVVHITGKSRIDVRHRVAKDMFYRFDGLAMNMPERWLPDPLLLLRRRKLLGLCA